MLYRPNFCCQCGEKIARARWTILTSRRFCDFCEIEQKQHDLLPRAAIVVSLLIGAAGFTSYLGGARDGADAQRAKAAPTGSSRTEKSSSARRADANSHIRGNAGNAEDTPPKGGREPDSVQRPLPEKSSTEPIFYCTAITRKGTPCTRRVKTKGRCWQHKDQLTTEGQHD